MADAEGEGDPREYKATGHTGRYQPRDSLGTPSPGPSDASNTSFGHSATESGINGMCSDDSLDDLQDAPLDFSVRRTEIPVQNLNNRLANGLHRSSHEHKSRGNYGGDNLSYATNDTNRRDLTAEGHVIKTEAMSPPRRKNGAISPGSNGDRHPMDISEEKIGEPQIALPGMLPGTMLPGGAAGLLPLFPPGMLPNTAMLNGFPFPQDIKNGKQNQNGKSVRPFKAYNKEPPVSQVPPFGALPAIPQMPGLDLAAAHALAVNSEEMFSKYKNYVMALQDQLNGQRSSDGSSSSSPKEQSPLGPHSGIQSPTGFGQNGNNSLLATGNTSMSSYMSTSGSPVISPTSPSDPLRHHYPRHGATRKRGRILPDEQKDEAYWERRRKNNEAAKRSRDSRRAKEDEIAIRAAFLEQENLKLRVEVAALKNETAKLRCMLYNS